MTQCRAGGRWLGLGRVSGGSRGSGKSRYGGGRQKASACPWPAASQLSHVPCQALRRGAAPTPRSAWSFFTSSQLCPHCPHGMWQQLGAWKVFVQSRSLCGLGSQNEAVPGVSREQQCWGQVLGVTCHSPACRGAQGCWRSWVMLHPHGLCDMNHGAACWGTHMTLLSIQLFCSLWQMLRRSGVDRVCRMFTLTLC